MWRLFVFWESKISSIKLIWIIRTFCFRLPTPMETTNDKIRVLVYEIRIGGSAWGFFCTRQVNCKPQNLECTSLIFTATSDQLKHTKEISLIRIHHSWCPPPCLGLYGTHQIAAVPDHRNSKDLWACCDDYACLALQRKVAPGTSEFQGSGHLPQQLYRCAAPPKHIRKEM